MMKFIAVISAFYFLAIKATQEAEGIENGILIVNGDRAETGQFPYHIDLQKNDTKDGVVCSGALVEVAGHQVGVTSSSCFTNANTSVPWKVMGGYTGIYEYHSKQEKLVDTIVKHPNYKNGQLSNDIAIVFFQPFEINDTVKPVPLPVAGQTKPQGNMTITGWGKFQYNGNPSYSLRFLNLTMVDDTVCVQDYGTGLTGVVCAQSLEANKFPYIGDEGGPAVSQAGYLAGIFLKSDQNISAIFTDVSYFTTWIETTVKEDNGITNPTTDAATSSNPTTSAVTSTSTNPTSNASTSGYTSMIPSTNATTSPNPTTNVTTSIPTNPSTSNSTVPSSSSTGPTTESSNFANRIFQTYIIFPLLGLSFLFCSL